MRILLATTFLVCCPSVGFAQSQSAGNLATAHRHDDPHLMRGLIFTRARGKKGKRARDEKQDDKKSSMTLTKRLPHRGAALSWASLATSPAW